MNDLEKIDLYDRLLQQFKDPEDQLNIRFIFRRLNELEKEIKNSAGQIEFLKQKMKEEIG